MEVLTRAWPQTLVVDGVVRMRGFIQLDSEASVVHRARGSPRAMSTIVPAKGLFGDWTRDRIRGLFRLNSAAVCFA